MATNDDNDNKRNLSAAGGLLRTALSLAPLGVGIGYAYNRISTVGGGFTAPRNSLKDLGTASGKKLKASLAQSAGTREKAAEALAKSLVESEALNKVWSEMSQRNALLQSVVSTLDDPNIGLDQATKTTMRDALLSAIGNENASKEVKDQLSDAVKTIANSGSKQLRQQFADAFGQFKDIGNHLMPPSVNMPMGEAFNPIQYKDLPSKAAQARYKAYTNMLGREFDIVEHVSADGLRGYYAKLNKFDNGAGFIGLAPLDLTHSKVGNVPRFVMGEAGQTSYVGNRAFLKARETHAFLQGKESVSFRDLQKAGALMGFEDFFMEEVSREYRTAGRNIKFMDKSRLGANVREGAELRPRFSYAGGVQDENLRKLQTHLNKSANVTHNVVQMVGIENLPKELQENYPQELLKIRGVDTGVNPARLFRRTEEGRISATLGVRSGQISQIQTGGETTRASLPSTAREQQIFGRDEMFGGTNEKLGQSFQTLEGRIGWGEALTGHSNRIVVMDPVGGFGFKGTGEGFAINPFESYHQTTIPVLNPTEMKVASTPILDRLMQRGVGNTTYFTLDEIRQMGGVIGIGEQGPQMFQFDPNLHHGVEMTISEATRVGSKSELKVAIGARKINRGGTKLFSTGFKGTVSPITRKQVEKMLPGAGALLGQGIGNAVFTDAAMLKKAPDFLNRQMISGLGFFKAMKDPFAEIAAMTAPTNKMMYGILTDNKNARVAEAVVHHLANSDLSAKQVGAVLGGAWHFGGKHSKAGFGIEQGQLKSLVEHAFPGMSADILSAMQHGPIVSVDSMTAGPTPGSWGFSQASIEPRNVKMMHQRLMAMGMSMDESSDLVAGVLAKKSGMGQQLNTVMGLHRMQASLVGAEGLGTAAESVRTMNVAEIREHMINDPRGLTSLLEQGDLRIDMSDFSGLRGAEALEAAAGKHFSQGSIFLPGGDFLSNLKGAQIKGASGPTIIAPEYLSMVNKLGRNLQELAGSSTLGEQHADRLLEEFKQQATKLYSGTSDFLLRGKIRGTTNIQGATYNLSTGYNMNKRQLSTARKLFNRSSGQGVFMDSTAFLEQMKSFMGTRGRPSVKASRMLRDFYLSGYGDITKGVVGIGGRHPTLSMGHIHPSLVFRDVGEMFGGTDETWERFMATKRGRTALAKLSEVTKDVRASWKGSGSGGISGFQDIAKLYYSKQNRGHVNQFFDELSGTLKDVVNWEGGGRIYYPQLDTELVTKSGKVIEASLSQMSGAIGDADGDYYTMMLFHGKTADKLRAHMLGGRTSEEIKASRLRYMQTEARYRIGANIYMEEAKGALESRMFPGEPMSAARRMMEDLLKEKGMKGVGPLDVKLNTIRTGILSFSQDTVKNADALSMLKVLEEFSTIKGKKLEKYEDLSGALEGAVGHAYKTGSTEQLELFVKDLFKGSELLSDDGIEIIGTSLTEGEAKGLGDMAAHISGQRYNVKDVMDTIKMAIHGMRDSGNLQDFESKGRLTSQLMGGNAAEAFRMLNEGSANLGSAVLHGNPEHLMASIENLARAQQRNALNTMGKIDRYGVGAIAAGAVGAMALSYLLGDRGYSPTPMTMPGEMVSNDTRTAIANNSLFEGMAPTMEPEQPWRDPIAGRPINMGQTYLANPSRYQIYGETNSSAGFSGAANAMGRLSGGGTVTINDRRRPITQNYLDRLLGD